jgi:transposase
MPAFVPVQIMAEPPISLPAPSPSKEVASAHPSRIEITLPDGTCVGVGSDVGLVALRRVMAAVRR